MNILKWLIRGYFVQSSMMREASWSYGIGALMTMLLFYILIREFQEKHFPFNFKTKERILPVFYY